MIKVVEKELNLFDEEKILYPENINAIERLIKILKKYKKLSEDCLFYKFAGYSNRVIKSIVNRSWFDEHTHNYLHTWAYAKNYWDEKLANAALEQLIEDKRVKKIIENEDFISDVYYEYLKD
jgi:hypothetical protein